MALEVRTIGQTQFAKLEAKLGLTSEELQLAVNEIKKLNPKPANAAPDNSRPTEYVIPDFIVTAENGEVELIINSKHAPDLFISNSFKETLQHFKSFYENVGYPISVARGAYWLGRSYKKVKNKK